MDVIFFLIFVVLAVVLCVQISVTLKRKRDSNASARGSQGGKLVGKRFDEAKSQELEPSFADLPSAITSLILLQLPIKSLLICKCVCKTWKVVISDPHFTRFHFERSPASVLIRTNDPERVSRTLHLLEYEPLHLLDYESKKFDDREFPSCYCKDDFLKPECKNHLKLELKFKLPLRDAKLDLNKIDKAKNPSRERRYRKPKDDKFEVVNSCNGILCLRGPTIKDLLVVCNPITGEFMKLPESSEIEKTQEPTFDFYVGFGFQLKTNEYKVIRMWKRVLNFPIYTHRWEFCEPIVEIHTLGTPMWRNVGVDPIFNFDRLAFPSYLNGALHWVRFNASETSILCFNFESERFQSFPSPPCLIANNQISDSTFSMGELWGVLYICDASNLFGPITIWIMEEYGIGESWTTIFHLGRSVELRWPIGLPLPVKHFKIGAGILMHYSCDCFIYCESENYGFKLYKVRGTKSKFEVIPHIPSLISLKDSVKGDNVEVLNVHSRCAKFKLQEENEVLFLAEENVELDILFASSEPADEEEFY